MPPRPPSAPAPPSIRGYGPSVNPSRASTRLLGDLAVIRSLHHETDDEVVVVVLQRALATGHFSVVAAAAELAADRELAQLHPPLISAWERLYVNAREADPSCTGKWACAAALDKLECADRAPFERGATYIQMQPSFPTPEDTASGLRARCVLALARLGGLDALMTIAVALSDTHDQVRSAAATGLAFTGEAAAAAMALQKILALDPEPAVTADALGSLIALRPAEGLACAARLLDGEDRDLPQCIVLVLGHSGQDGAVPLLVRESERAGTVAYRKAVFVAMGLLRSVASKAALLSIVRTGPLSDARFAIAALATQSHSDAMRAAVIEAAAGRDLDQVVESSFA